MVRTMKRTLEDASVTKRQVDYALSRRTLSAFRQALSLCNDDALMILKKRYEPMEDGNPRLLAVIESIEGK